MVFFVLSSLPEGTVPEKFTSPPRILGYSGSPRSTVETDKRVYAFYGWQDPIPCDTVNQDIPDKGHFQGVSIFGQIQAVILTLDSLAKNQPQLNILIYSYHLSQ